MSLTPHAQFLRSKIDHISANSKQIKKALARESGAQGVLFDEKTEGRKSRDTVPLSTNIKTNGPIIEEDLNKKLFAVFFFLPQTITGPLHNFVFYYSSNLIVMFGEVV
jgi:hypothetical protein